MNLISLDWYFNDEDGLWSEGDEIGNWQDPEGVNTMADFIVEYEQNPTKSNIKQLGFSDLRWFCSRSSNLVDGSHLRRDSPKTQSIYIVDVVAGKLKKEHPDSGYDILIVLDKDYSGKDENKILDLCYDIDLKYNILLDIHLII